MSFQRTFALALGAVAALSMAGCGDCSKQIAAVDGFIANPDNQRCQVDADCVAVTVGCHTPSGGLCGQAALSSSAAASAKWTRLSDALKSCVGTSCAVCAAALIPSCSQGLCSR